MVNNNIITESLVLKHFGKQTHKQAPYEKNWMQNKNATYEAVVSICQMTSLNAAKLN